MKWLFLYVHDFTKLGILSKSKIYIAMVTVIPQFYLDGNELPLLT